MAQQEQTRPLAVVTGASSGIGYELAAQFVDHGYDLIIAAEDAGITEAAQKLQVPGCTVEAVLVDLATYEGVELLCDRINSAGRAVDACAINAGIGVGGDFAHTDLKAELNMINLNVTGSVHLAKFISQKMIEQGHGRLLITASIASVMPAPFQAVYGGTKAFLLSFAEALRSELKDTGVTVTALMPGATETNFFHRAGMDDTEIGVDEKDDPAEVARQGFEALMAGKDHVVAGSIKVKMEGAMAKVLPESVKADLQRGKTEPGSAERH
jgi:short-subunit dehydrogenase